MSKTVEEPKVSRLSKYASLVAEAIAIVASLVIALYVIEYYEVTVGYGFDAAFAIGVVAYVCMLVPAYWIISRNESEVVPR